MSRRSSLDEAADLLQSLVAGESGLKGLLEPATKGCGAGCAFVVDVGCLVDEHQQSLGEGGKLAVVALAALQQHPCHYPTLLQVCLEAFNLVLLFPYGAVLLQYRTVLLLDNVLLLPCVPL